MNFDIMSFIDEYMNILIIIASFIVVIIIGYFGDKRFRRNGVLESNKSKTKKEEPKKEEQNIVNSESTESLSKPELTVVQEPTLSESANKGYEVNQMPLNDQEQNLNNSLEPVSYPEEVQSKPMPQVQYQEQTNGQPEVQTQVQPLDNVQEPFVVNEQFVEYNFSPEDNINNIF